MSRTVRRKASGGGTGWNRRLAGIALVAFFALGYFLGLGSATNLFTHRAIDVAARYRSQIREQSALIRLWPPAKVQPPEPVHTGGPLAMVERRDGFYALYEWGELRGPVSAGTEDNLPIISGPALESASAADLVGDAKILVRAEVALAEMISELRLDDDGEAALFLDRSRTEVAIDLDHAAAELARAGRVLRRWRGREAEIAALDMTTPGQAVMRLRPGALARLNGEGAGKPGKSGKPTMASAPAGLLAGERRPGAFAVAGKAPMSVVVEAGLR
jgi:hypothetical protein